jgi:hypothetical protein
MKIKPGILILVVVISVLVMEVYYLKGLPSSFVRIYYTSEMKDFNRPPTEAMTVEIDGYVFSYRIPHSVKQDSFKEARDLIQSSDKDVIDSLILIANWVRSTLRFGMPNYNSSRFLVEDILNNSRNNDVSMWCDFYSRLFVITCQSLGISARIIELEGHIVPEAFIRKNNKWIMIDPTFGYYMLKGSNPLSVVEIIECYKKEIPLDPVIFAKDRGDDCLYSGKDEVNLKKIYLNGFTVVSDQNVDRKKIKETILKALQLPIAKMQFIDTNSTWIGYKERTIRYIIMLNIIILIIVSSVTLLKRR